MDTTCKTDLVVNNLSEVFNKFILKVRNKPIVTMIDSIRTKIMSRFVDKREGLEKAQWEITLFYTEKLELMKKYSQNCKPIFTGQGIYQVTSGERTYPVDLEKHTC